MIIAYLVVRFVESQEIRSIYVGDVVYFTGLWDVKIPPLVNNINEN